MSLRLFLVLLAVCLALGYGAGFVLTRQWGSALRPTDVDPPEVKRARDALAAVRSTSEPAARRAARRAFLEAWPDSWVRAQWAAEVER